MSFLAEDKANSLRQGIKKYFISPCNTCEVIGKDLEAKHLQPMLAQDKLEWRHAIR